MSNKKARIRCVRLLVIWLVAFYAVVLMAGQRSSEGLIAYDPLPSTPRSGPFLGPVMGMQEHQGPGATVAPGSGPGPHGSGGWYCGAYSTPGHNAGCSTSS